MAAMATTLTSSLTKAQFFDNKSSFHGSPLSTRAVQPIKSAPQNLAITMSAAAPYDLDNFKFQPIKESIVAREMTRRYMTDMITYADTDVVVVGAGSAGLPAPMSSPRIPTSTSPSLNNRQPGGGAWLGGQLFSAMVVRKPAHKFLDELEIEYDEQDNYVVIKHAALFTSTIMSKLLAALM
ncbi:UNVERIFIED_CONTAM: Thiamine thiazole synthase 2, chloroplastic [Sesamum radiatum]|uniref:Thiamine thiazole synthase 2, chloroplastic n=1 Tax=Sesamum radiatum TaxID=300843 RepID=A0AAW2T273_SESRA